MEWRFHETMQDAMRAIPDGASQDAGFSTPDIYGRASQFYLALRKMQGAKDEEVKKSEDVRLWRGLLTLLALRHHHSLPLRWEMVKLTPGDKVSDALREPKFESDDLIFDPEDSEEKEYTWDGKNFYVLTWELEGGGTQDLAVYSPLTLLYPVADWKEVLKNIAAHQVFLGRFFDVSEMTFQTCDVLEKDERFFTDLWLKKMIDVLQNTGKHSGPTPAARAVIQHLNSFQTDLRIASSSSEALSYEAFHAGYGSLVGAIPEPLWNAFQLQDGQIFSDQLCILRVPNSEGNPFSSRGCQYADKYEIKGVSDQDCKWFAFLPIHPNRRDTCVQDCLADNISMQYRYDKKTERETIRVSIALPGTPTQVRDYPIENEQTDRKGRAVFYPDKGAELGMSDWPLFAVWPATIGQGWKEYYVARADMRDAGLRIYGEEGTGWGGIGAPPVKKGHNSLAVKTSYVPDAIPLVRLMPTEDGEGETPVSIGMITPKMQSAVNLPPVSAEVAVDFGTSSSRVYYQLTGTPRTVELFVQNDEPLEVTAYAVQDKDNHLIFNRDKSKLMSTDFVSPEEPESTGGIPANPLFSMFLSSMEEPQLETPPILEGVIYQPDPQDDLVKLKHLITDLKWNGQNGIYFTPFMQQLCLHIMALLYKQYHVNRISWHYALPKSMDSTQVQSMRSIWTGQIKSFLDTASGGNIIHTVAEPMTESVAASMYFNENGQGYVQPAIGYLVVDIGAGSTDVALWQSSPDGQRPELKWHSSVTVAGRDMFTRRLETRINDMAGGIANSDLQSLLTHWNQAPLESGPKTAYVDRLLSTYGEELRARYETINNNSQAPWAAEMRGQILRSVSLMMFSLGYQVGLEIDEGTLSEPHSPGYFAICVGGRGSNVLDWLMLDEMSNYPELREFFKSGVSASRTGGAGWPDVQIKIQKSPSPKCEVAMGLLAQNTTGVTDGGWTFRSTGSDMQNAAYASDAAEQFLDAFNSIFPGVSIYGSNSRLVDKTSKRVDTSLLSGRSLDAMQGRRRKDDAFRVLMESIHGIL